MACVQFLPGITVFHIRTGRRYVFERCLGAFIFVRREDGREARVALASQDDFRHLGDENIPPLPIPPTACSPSSP